MDVLIFDMDGVLIDVSNSYRETIRRTVHIYLEKYLGFESGKGRLVTKEEITLFKSIGGFNNDWDLTSGLLLYLLSLSDIPPSPKRKRFSAIKEIIPYLKTESSKFPKNVANLLQKKHLAPFLERVKSKGGGLKGVRQALGSLWDGWVYGAGDLSQENVVKRIFQEVYLGEKFTSYYHLQPLFYRGQGYYLRERPLISREILATLRKKLRMGIAGGRPRFEAELALKRFRLIPYFGSVITLDECEEEEARILRSTGKRMNCTKPHPYSLLRVVQEMGIPNPRCGYVGDVADDMKAAQAAKKELQILAIGFLSSSIKRKAMKESLFKAGAHLVIQHPRELLHLIKSIDRTL
jgi:phosphoglycolate phosphatase-like HAD superfamily hydrolase